MDNGRAIVGVRQRADQTAAPVEVFCGYVRGHISEVLGQLGHVCIDGQYRVKAGGAEANPFNALQRVRHVAANLADAHDAGTVDADGAVDALPGVLRMGVGIVRRSLIVGGENVLHILHCDLPLRYKGPGNVVALGRKVRVVSLPAVLGGTEIPAHEPGPGRVVYMVGVRAGTEAVPGIEASIIVGVQMVFLNEGLQVGGAQVFLPRTESILKIEPVQAKLVGHNDAFLVRYPPGNPVVAADGLHPPDFVLIVEGNAVGFVSTVLLQQLSQPQHALPGRADIGQHQSDQIFLADAAGDILFTPAPGLLILDHRVGPQHPGIGGDGFRGTHAHVGRIDARGGPDALRGVHIGAGCIAQRLLRQGNGQVSDDAFIVLRLLFRVDEHQLFYVKRTVIGSGDHG